MADRERAGDPRVVFRSPAVRGRAVVALGTISSLATLASCTPRVPVPIEPTYTYAIDPPPDGSWQLKVEATFEGAPSARLVAPDSGGAIHDVALVGRGGSTTPVVPDGEGWLAPACTARCTVRYVLDLDVLAASCRHMDCERRVGDAMIGRASSFMLRPQPMGDAVLRVRAVGANVGRFATGLRRAPDGGYVFATRELGEASFTAFGAIRRVPLVVPSARATARLDLALIGPPLAMGDAAAAAFVGESASCVAALFGRFPVDATIFVVPVRGADHVVFGRVMSLAGASVALLIGDETPASRVHEEWVVVHELFHLGTPSFVGEGQWLEEGLATYFEPILRERAGWMTESELWSHFVREMPRGLRESDEAASLEDRDDTDSTYWGGALFALLADVRIREASGGARSLDDVLRAGLEREGDATHAARVADFLRLGDETTGTHGLTAAYESWARRGENPDLDTLWRQLGIGGVDDTRNKGGHVVLHDDAPLSAVRRAIAAAARF